MAKTRPEFGKDALRSDEIAIIAPARLHLGFYDLHGGNGRLFGSLGVGINEIYTHVTASESKDVIVRGESRGRASNYVGRILEYFDIDQGVTVTVHKAIPEHTGLGSGTQLSLAIAHAVAGLFDKKINIASISRILDRGNRSGVGIGTFKHGGIVVDGGRGVDTIVPPVISHQDFPEAWRLLLVIDHGIQGINGIPEIEAFKNLPPMEESTSEYLCRLILTRLLPSVSEEDCRVFGMALAEMQTIIGDYFAPAQGGRFSSHLVEEVLQPLIPQGATAVGQSSWGPAGFALFENETRAYHGLRKIRENYKDNNRLEFRICSGRNYGAEIVRRQSNVDFNYGRRSHN